ncbi:hypothetical protein IGG79_001807 [Enterococcus faecium]|nr:hypothetical protein [Enterococcus faecium]
MKYIYTPVPFTEIAKGLEYDRLKAKDVYFETASFKGVRVLSDTKLDLEDCAKTTFYLKKEMP